MPHQAISTRIARTYKATYGRGPTKIATFVLPDLVILVVEDLNTAAQDTLAQIGDFDLLEAGHQQLHRVMLPDMTTAIEEILGRRVRGSIAGFNGPLNAATNTFLLEPNGDEPSTG